MATCTHKILRINGCSELRIRGILNDDCLCDFIAGIAALIRHRIGTRHHNRTFARHRFRRGDCNIGAILINRNAQILKFFHCSGSRIILQCRCVATIHRQISNRTIDDRCDAVEDRNRMRHRITHIATSIRHHILSSNGNRAASSNRFHVCYLQVIKLRTAVSKLKTQSLQILRGIDSAIGNVGITAIEICFNKISRHNRFDTIEHLECLHKFFTYITTTIGYSIIALDNNRACAICHITMGDDETIGRCAVVSDRQSKCRQFSCRTSGCRKDIRITAIVSHHLQFA